MSKVLLGLSLLALTGCSATNLADIVKAAASDNASLCATVTSVYGTGRLARTNIQSGTVTCTQEGMTVKQGQWSESVTDILDEMPAQ